MKMKKDYCKPNTRLVKLMSPYALLEESKNVNTGGGAGSGGHGETFGSSRYGNWDYFDEDLLDDLSKEEIQELD